MGVDPKTLPGIVIDDTQAKLIGDWKSGHGLEGYIGTTYLYHAPAKNATARFEFKVPKSGKYEVREAHQPHANRANNTSVTIESADGNKTVQVNQRAAGTQPHGFVSLCVFRFDADKTGAFIISAEGAKVYVHADSIQVVPAE